MVVSNKIDIAVIFYDCFCSLSEINQKYIYKTNVSFSFRKISFSPNWSINGFDCNLNDTKLNGIHIRKQEKWMRLANINRTKKNYKLYGKSIAPVIRWDNWMRCAPRQRTIICWTFQFVATYQSYVSATTIQWVWFSWCFSSTVITVVSKNNQSGWIGFFLLKFDSMLLFYRLRKSI